MTGITRSEFRSISRLSVVPLFLFVAACGAPGTTSSQPRLQDGVIVDAIDLAAAFESNEPYAAKLYVGKRGRIRGLIARLEPLTDGKVSLVFKTSQETFRPVHCVFDATAAGELDRFSSGDGATVTGEIRGFAESRYFVTVEGCAVD